MNLTNAEIKNLKDKKYRKQNGLILVEGEKFCRDILLSGAEIVCTITTNSNLKNFPNITIVTDKVLNSIATTKTPQNTICVCKPKQYEIASRSNSLILDNLQDPGNVGTLIRSAIAFGFEDIYLLGGADPYSEKVIRSSAGLVLSARVHVVDFETLQKNKDKIAKNFVTADMFGANLSQIRLPKSRFAVIIGNEGNGVSTELMAISNFKVAIPMSPKVESLNAGVAGSIIMQKLSELN